MKNIICAIAMLWSLAGMAQDVLTGSVYDSNRTALAGATVVMLNSKDSTYIQGVVSGEDGSFSMALSKNDFIIVASYLGYETTAVNSTGNSAVTIVLKETASQLQGVTVTASRPVSRLTRDGFVYSVKGTTLAKSGSLNDVLEQMPLVKKTPSGYDVMGKGEAVFYLNGHRVYNLSELDNIASRDVKSVKIITSPGAKYDSSMSSVIEINTALDVFEGLSVNARSTWKQNHKSSWTEQLNMRYGKGRWSIYDNFKYQADNDLTWKDLTQTVFSNQLWNEVSNEQEHRKRRAVENIAGFDCRLSDDSYIGGRYSLTFNIQNSTYMESTNEITAGGEHYDILKTSGTERGHKYPRHLFNIYYSGKIGGFKLNADLDYITDAVQTDNVYNEVSETDDDRAIDAVSDICNRLLSVRASVAHKLLGGDATVGMEYRHTNRNDDYTNSNEYIPTSVSLLKETQVSPFIDYSVLTRVGLFGLGVRMESTQFKYYSDNVYVPEQSQSTVKFFPQLSWGIRLGALQAQLSYSTNINRPTYRQLSNNLMYGSRYTWQTGNPLLRPEYIHEVSLQGMWHSLQFQVSYADAHNAIVYWATLHESNPAVSVMSYKNLPSVKQVRVAMVYNKTVGIWSPQLTVAVNRQFLHLSTQMGMHSLNSPIWIAKLSNNFKVTPTLSMFLTANWQSTGDYRNVHLNKHVWHASFNITKSFCKDRFSVQLKATDIFRTNKDGNEIYNDKMVMNLLNKYDSRSVSVTSRWLFNEKTYKRYSHSQVDTEIRRL